MQSLKTIVVTVVLLCSSAGSVGAQEKPEAIPDRVVPVVPGREAPEWVSADQVLRGGHLQRDLFAPEEISTVQMMIESGRSVLERSQSAPEGERLEDSCVYVSSSDDRTQPAARTLEELAETSGGVYVGTVLAERAGLLRGAPRALLRVRIDRVLRHEASGPAPKTLLMAYPEVKMHLGNICVGAKGPRHPARPQVAQGILLFSTAKVPLTGNVILAPRDEEIFFTLPDGSTSLPAHFGELLSPTGEPVSLDFVVQAADKAIAAFENGGA